MSIAIKNITYIHEDNIETVKIIEQKLDPDSNQVSDQESTQESEPESEKESDEESEPEIIQKVKPKIATNKVVELKKTIKSDILPAVKKVIKNT